jgi:hypothetical protein
MHFAAYPTGPLLRCTPAGCRQCGTVPGPFTGSGTPRFAVLLPGRRLTGMDLAPGFVRLPVEPDRPWRRRSGGRLTSTFLPVYPCVPGGPDTTTRGLP